jgi:hypothetical protein
VVDDSAIGGSTALEEAQPVQHKDADTSPRWRPILVVRTCGERRDARNKNKIQMYNAHMLPQSLCTVKNRISTLESKRC